MFCQRCVRRARALVAPAFRIGVAALVLGCAGCASSQREPSRIAGPMASADPRHWRVEIEDDGVPSQLAPRLRPSVADDPSEPWSPNYGSERAPGGAGLTAPQVPSGPPREPESRPPPAGAKPRPSTASLPAVKVAGSSAAAMDPDEIIRLAIAAHEMRRRE